MHASSQQPDNGIQKLRSTIIAVLDSLDQVLPNQAPIHDFVHQNPLHGFQHLPFEEALERFQTITGNCGYLPEEKSRNFYRQGRINDEDVSAALASNPELQAEQLVFTLNGKSINRQAIYRVSLLFDLSGISPSRFNWLCEEMDALTTIQSDVSETARKQLLTYFPAIGNPVKALWDSILILLNLHQTAPHPENMLDMPIEQAEDWLIQALPDQDPELWRLRGASIRQQNMDQAALALDEKLCQLGDTLTLRSFVAALCNIDILDAVRPQLIRLCASAMDEGVAAWQMPEHNQLGFYSSWRATMIYDANLFLHELPDWLQIITTLPDTAIDTIILQLYQQEIPEEKWEGYLRQLALEVPGWSGLINWRQQHPNYRALENAAPNLADYLAIRLTLDRLWLNQVCRDIWHIEANSGSLQTYFRKNLPEFIVRKCLYQRNLPEYLTELAESLTAHSSSERQNRQAWQELADLIGIWQLSPMAENNNGLSICNTGWRLFRLFQHLGINAAEVQQLTKNNLIRIIAILDDFNETEREKVWLTAYEQHYRERFFQALRANHNRGRWAQRAQRPTAQIIFCMDDREESFRRHLEELNPAIETLGAAGFFGLTTNFQGLDDADKTGLYPAEVTPARNIQGVCKSADAQIRHKKGRKLLNGIAYLLHQGLRRNLLLSYPIINMIAPLTLVGLLAKSWLPKNQHRLLSNLAHLISPDAKTEIHFRSSDQATIASPESPKPGFTDIDQADRVAELLRTTSLTSGFSPLIVLMGHGSVSQNNPHSVTFDCDVCRGRHGGSNARVFAAMANRPEIRNLLTEQDIFIPSDTWFIGSEHDTCDENIIWYDLDVLPAMHQPDFKKLLDELALARKMSAHERCRRLASAPVDPALKEALSHIEERATDFSQVRPELGHATNAAAIIGRRSLSQGIFFDRRVFLISYDATQDSDGAILENILLANGPVVAGINLAYYFSTVNNEHFGCGSMVSHNITGLFGVMEGTGSDLGTGLPQQMVEIHEPMRLEILVEANTSVLESIYQRQESLRELIAGGWVHLSTKDPDSGEIYRFKRGTGFVRWQANTADIGIFDHSLDCYRNQSSPVSPALIKQPDSFGL